MARRKLTRVVDDYIAGLASGHPLKLTAVDVADRYFGSQEQATVHQAYNLLGRVKHRFDSIRDEDGRPIYQFGNPLGAGGHMGHYELMLNVNDSATEMQRGFRRVEAVADRNFHHAVVAVAVYPANKHILIQEAGKITKAAMELSQTATQYQLAAVNFFEKLPKGETDEKARN